MCVALELLVVLAVDALGVVSVQRHLVGVMGGELVS